MSGFVEGIDRSQTSLFPAELEDYVAEDNPVQRSAWREGQGQVHCCRTAAGLDASSAHDWGAGSDPPHLLLWVHLATGVHLGSGLITQFRSLARVWTRPAERSP